MAFNFNDPGSSVNTQQEQQTQQTTPSADTRNAPISNEATQTADANIRGLSDVEIKNPDTIVVTVSDSNTPVIILFGARTSGKTMTLIRLTRYLESMGYKVIPDPIFRPGADTHYQRMCKEFNRLAYSDYAAMGNDIMSFMLVKVISPSGRALCQILEAPGEHYFDPDIPDRHFPVYIENIKRIPNRKTWVFIVEENWGGSQEVRTLYANKIIKMQRSIHPIDKPAGRIIFTCHKVDKSDYFRPDGYPNVPEIFRNIENQYPNIFTRYVNHNPITRWFSPYNFDFVTFSAGVFTPTGDGRQIYTPGEDYYPKQLWEAIKKNI